MIKTVLSIGFAIMICRDASCQLNPTFEAALRCVLTDSSVSSEVFAKRRAYIFANREFDKNVVDFDSLSELSWKFNTLDSALTTRLFESSYGPVIMFGDAYLLGGVSNFEIDRVVVLDKYKASGGGISMVFHTTNCESKLGHEKSRKSTAFKKFRAKLTLKGLEWKVVEIKISDIGFTTIVE